jgi:hypothetical protein
LDQTASSIREKKSNIRRNLRNSLDISKTITFLNLKDEKLTASSLKDLDGDH